MKKIIFTFLISVLGFGAVNAQKTEISYTLAERYFVRNDYPGGNFHMLKITTQEKFDSIFGKAPIMGSEVTAINFKKSFVIALIDNTSNLTESIDVKSLTEENEHLRLIYDIRQRSQPSSAYFRFCKILIIDKKYEKTVLASSTTDSNNPMVGSDLDEYGCKPSIGYFWSELKKECIDSGIVKYILEGADMDTNQSAALLFNEDRSKAEIIGSKYSHNLILSKKGKKNVWKNGKLTLTETSKNQFILKEKRKEIAKGKLR